MDKSLSDKAIQFKGKNYVEVKERVNYFNETYPNGCIQTIKLESNDRVEFKAIVIPDLEKPLRFFTGHSQASFADTTSFVNKTSAMENAETSAVGRALAFMSIGVIDSVASMDEITKANNIKTSVKPISEHIEHSSDMSEEEIIQEFNDLGNDEPFESKQPNLPKLNPDNCKDCGEKKIMGKNGKLYCKPCYIKWANENKKK